MLASALSGCASLDPGTAPRAAAPATAPAAAMAAETQAGTQPAQPATVGEKPVVAEEEGGRVEGFLASKLVARWTGGAQDVDLDNLLSLDWSDPRSPGIRAHVLTRISADLNGHQADNPFNGLTDLDGEALDLKLYDAYVDIAKPDAPGRLRIGRQLEYETPEIVHYDGLSYRTNPSGASELVAGLYGGIPVRLYQDTGDRSLIGAFAENRPWHGARARIDWMHLEDDTLVESGAGILSLALWQQFERGWQAEAQYTRLEQQDRDLRLQTRWTSPGAGFSVTANWYQLFQTQNQLPADIDPYTSILMALYPYQQFGLAASAELNEKLRLDLAVDARQVDDSSDVGEFNRDWERYRATTVFPDVLTQGFDASIFGDLWEGDDRETTAWGLDFAYDTQEEWRFGAGTYFSLYKYDLFLESERDDVRSYYARATWKCSSKLTFEFSYDFEDDEQDRYNVLRGGALWRF